MRPVVRFPAQHLRGLGFRGIHDAPELLFGPHVLTERLARGFPCLVEPIGIPPGCKPGILFRRQFMDRFRPGLLLNREKGAGLGWLEWRLIY